MKVRVLCFTWNTQSVRLAERSGGGNQPASWLPFEYKRYDPDFVPALMERVHESGCDVFVCALQEAAKPGSHFLSHALPPAMAALGYDLLHRLRWLGVGATSFQRLRDDGELMPRGLRLAVFVRREWARHRRLTVDDGWWPATAVDCVTRGKGGVAVSLHIPSVGRVCFLNCHLPFDAPSVAQNNDARFLSGVSSQARALRSLLDRARRALAPHYFIVLGDLNFRLLNRAQGVDPARMWQLLYQGAAARERLYRGRDELRQAIDYGALPPLREGPGAGDTGPSAFMPTGKMRHGRDSGSVERRAYYFGHGAAQNPSWCDRVLFARDDEVASVSADEADTEFGSDRPFPYKNSASVPEGAGDLHCLFYNRFEAGQTMTRSDHSAVLALIEIDSDDTLPPASPPRYETPLRIPLPSDDASAVINNSGNSNTSQAQVGADCNSTFVSCTGANQAFFDHDFSSSGSISVLNKPCNSNSSSSSSGDDNAQFQNDDQRLQEQSERSSRTRSRTRSNKSRSSSSSSSSRSSSGSRSDDAPICVTPVSCSNDADSAADSATFSDEHSN